MIQSFNLVDVQIIKSAPQVHYWLLQNLHSQFVGPAVLLTQPSPDPYLYLPEDLVGKHIPTT
jgi:hypothetical protein